MVSRFLKSDAAIFAGLGLVLFFTCIFLRPLMPIDETRYMGVAWEMWLKKGWFDPLTMNFEPYSHKPPLLFWLINISWGIFGVSRWAGLVPVMLMTFANIYLVGILYKKLFPQSDAARVRWVMFGNFVFFFYGTLMMFDMGLCALVQTALICLLNFARNGRWRWMIAMGLVLGFGVLMKGPVAYLYAIFPVLFGPKWTQGSISNGRWYGGFLIAFAVSVVPVLAWLIPVLSEADHQFAFWLVWNQTAGRVTGNFSSAHVRHFYFYLLLIPLLFLPWAFFPAFWRGIKSFPQNSGTRFLFFWFVPTFIAFCMISGKQAHYLVPLMPAVAMFIAERFSTNVSISCLRRVGILMTAVFLLAHMVAAQTTFPRYDLKPVVDVVEPFKGKDIAYVSNYHGELGFLARMEHGIDDVNMTDIHAWFKKHPDGVAMIRYKDPEEVKDFNVLLVDRYRGRFLGVVTADSKN